VKAVKSDGRSAKKDVKNAPENCDDGGGVIGNNCTIRAAND